MSLIDEIQHGNVGGAITLMNTASQPVVLLNQRSEVTGEFPLHYAVKQGLVELASMMLEKGAKVNCSNASGLSPLHYAARKGNLDLLGLLLSKGALRSQDTQLFWTPLHYAVYHGHKAIVEKLLEFESAIPGSQLVNETDSWVRSALHIACKQNRIDIANLLIKAGAQIRKDSTGRNPFSYLNLREPNKDNTDFFLDVNYAETSANTLSTDLRSLFSSGDLSDLTFLVEGLPEPNEDGIVPEGALPTTQEYKAHRAIVHARCPSLLSDQPPFRSVKPNNRIDINGVTHSLFAAVLEYIYCGVIDFKETDLDFVFNLAKKGQELNLASLSSFAESMILSNLNEGNAVSILEAATIFGCCPRVENYCRYYIVRNFDKISQAAPEDLDKLPPSQFESVLARLDIVPEPSPPLVAIEVPPNDLFPKAHKPAPPMMAAMPVQPPMPAYAPGPPPATNYATPKPARPKKPKAAKADKVDSPRSRPGGMPGMASGSPPGINRAPGMAAGGSGMGSPELLQGHTFDLVKKLHKEIMAEVDADMFNSRVPYESMNLADYPWVIKRPMDLGLVLKNLDARKFKTIAEWAADVRLVWDNAKTYNAPESEVYKAAEALCRMTEQGYLKIQRQLELPPSYDPFIPKSTDWYVSVYRRHYQDFLDANPQYAQPINPVPAALPPPASHPKSSPGAKKTRAAPPSGTSPSGAGGNRKRKPDADDQDYEIAHAHTTAPGTQYNGNHAYNNTNMGAQMPMAAPSQASPAPALSQQQQDRIQERLSMLDEGQAGEVIKLLGIQPNEEGEYVILIETMPPETLRVLESFLAATTGPF